MGNEFDFCVVVLAYFGLAILAAGALCLVGWIIYKLIIEPYSERVARNARIEEYKAMSRDWQKNNPDKSQWH